MRRPCPGDAGPSLPCVTDTDGLEVWLLGLLLKALGSLGA